MPALHNLNIRSRSVEGATVTDASTEASPYISSSALRGVRLVIYSSAHYETVVMLEVAERLVVSEEVGEVARVIGQVCLIHIEGVVHFLESALDCTGWAFLLLTHLC